jgi:hypothetical protein
MSKNYGPEHEWKNRERLQSEVLKHLQEHGPMHYDVLYVSFDAHRTASIRPVLADLITYGLISVEKDETVTITEAGLQTLADRD